MSASKRADQAEWFRTLAQTYRARAANLRQQLVEQETEADRLDKVAAGLDRSAESASAESK